jgi:predicted DNA-binding transcriptional regulator AlpA
MDGNNQEIINEREVADWLGLSEATLFRHRRDGTGPKFIQLSARRVAYHRSAIEGWLKERERQSLSSTSLVTVGDRSLQAKNDGHCSATRMMTERRCKPMADVREPRRVP